MIERAVTSKGVEVDLRYYEEIDDGMVEGWRCDLIEAYVGAEPVGYIKVAYVPNQTFAERYPDPFHFAVFERSSNRYSGLRHLLEEKPEQEWGKEDFYKAVETSYLARGWPDYDRLQAADLDQLRSWWQDRKRFLNREHRADMEHFRIWHVDKPRVDFIRVYDQRFGRSYEDGEATIGRYDQSSKDWRRHGIGTVLYEAAALWLSERGMVLWASGLQSHEAEHAWKHLAERYQLGSEPGKAYRRDEPRTFLDGSQVTVGSPQQAPQLEPVDELIEAPVTSIAVERPSAIDLS